jgi:tetratricopeptide (TPR) repeat protein
VLKQRSELGLVQPRETHETGVQPLELAFRHRVEVDAPNSLVGTGALQPAKQDFGSTRVGDSALPQAPFDLRVRRRLTLFACCTADAMLASVWWTRGERQEVDAHLDRAVAAISDRAPSSAKAHVLSAAARFRMLTHQDNQEAIALAQQALSVAEALDLQDIRADTLVTLGTARWIDGDAAGEADIEKGLRIALEHNALSAAQRAYNNLGIAAADRGDPRLFELLADAKRLLTRLGTRERFIDGRLTRGREHQGDWDEALREATDFIDECEHGLPHRLEPGLHMLRARIYYARDDLGGAWAECEKALSLVRSRHDPEHLVGTLCAVMELYAHAGRADEARALAKELMTNPASLADEVVSLAWVADWIGLDRAQVKQLGDRVPAHRYFWRPLGELTLSGDFAKVADIFGTAGLKDLEAGVRLRAAKALVGQQKPEAAAAQLEQALAFFRSVAASRYIREAEEIRDAISREQQEAAQPHA